MACGELIIAPLARNRTLTYLFKTPIAATIDGFKQLAIAAAPNMRGKPLPTKNHTPLERPIIPVAGGLILKWWSKIESYQSMHVAKACKEACRHIFRLF
jgi:hypothetical protein